MIAYSTLSFSALHHCEQWWILIWLQRRTGWRYKCRYPYFGYIKQWTEYISLIRLENKLFYCFVSVRSNYSRIFYDPMELSNWLCDIISTNSYRRFSKTRIGMFRVLFEFLNNSKFIEQNNPHFYWHARGRRHLPWVRAILSSKWEIIQHWRNCLCRSEFDFSRNDRTGRCQLLDYYRLLQNPKAILLNS